MFKKLKKPYFTNLVFVVILTQFMAFLLQYSSPRCYCRSKIARIALESYCELKQLQVEDGSDNCAQRILLCLLPFLLNLSPLETQPNTSFYKANQNHDFCNNFICTLLLTVTHSLPKQFLFF